MDALKRMRRLTRALLRRDAVERELDDELVLHLDLETERHRRAGLSPEDARQAATSALATMMGAIVLARAVGDKNMSDDILAAGRQALRRRAAAGSCDHKEKST